MDDKITQDELRKLFGDFMPLAVDFGPRRWNPDIVELHGTVQPGEREVATSN